MKNYSSLVGIALVATALIGCSEKEAVDAVATSTVATIEGVPGGAIVNTIEIVAEVIEIDQEARTAVLQVPSGASKTIQAGPEVINFDQIKVGDQVRATAAEELIIHMGGVDAAEGDAVAAAVVLAEKGAKPGAAVAGAVRTTATLTALDSEARTVTLTSDAGESMTFPVRPDIDMSQYQVGDKVVFEISQMVALTVKKVTD